MNFASNCGNFYTGAGWLGATSPTDGSHQGNIGQGGNCAGAGLLHPAELASGAINHAMYVLVQCDMNGSVYPVSNGVSGSPSCSGVLPYVG
jgi:hypothetical protein